jgi:retinol dehydrogenase-12
MRSPWSLGVVLVASDQAMPFLVYKPVFGAYTELFAGWSEEAGKPENDAKYIVPWGRFGELRTDVKASQDGVKLWEWCERESKPYM